MRLSEAVSYTLASFHLHVSPKYGALSSRLRLTHMIPKYGYFVLAQASSIHHPEMQPAFDLRTTTIETLNTSLNLMYFFNSSMTFNFEQVEYHLFKFSLLSLSLSLPPSLPPSASLQVLVYCFLWSLFELALFTGQYALSSHSSGYLLFILCCQ